MEQRGQQFGWIVFAKWGESTASIEKNRLRLVKLLRLPPRPCVDVKPTKQQYLRYLPATSVGPLLIVDSWAFRVRVSRQRLRFAGTDLKLNAGSPG